MIIPFGQKMLLVDGEEFPLLEVTPAGNRCCNCCPNSCLCAMTC